MKNILIVAFLFSSTFIYAQDKTKDKEKKKKTIKELTKSSKKIDGLFTIYQDTLTGELKMSIKEIGKVVLNCSFNSRFPKNCPNSL